MRVKSALRLPAALLLALVFLVSSGRAEDVELDWARYQDPRIEIPSPITVFSPKLKPLWLEALARPEVDLQRQAAQTIAVAHQRGMPDLADTASALMERLDAPGQHPVVRLAAARALIVLDARQAAPLLFKRAASDGLDMSALVEPVLAQWDHRPIRKVWVDRLNAPRPSLLTPRPSPLLLVLAIRGVAEVGETRAKPRLLDLAAESEVPPNIRMEAARALGRLETEGLEEEARNLAADKSPEKIVDRLVAVSLLASHRGDAAERLLLDLAIDPEPSVATIALGRLVQIDPMLVIPIAERTIASHDSGVRRLGARALIAWRTPEAVALLGPMLDDPHPDVRSYVRRSLVQMALARGEGRGARDERQETRDQGPGTRDQSRNTLDPGLSTLDSHPSPLTSRPSPFSRHPSSLAAPVLEEVLKMLATERPRGLEQASLAVVALDHKPAAGRLVELLEFERPEVFVTAAWGLRKLAVRDTLVAMFDKVRRETEKIQAGGYGDAHVSRQLSHLIEALGQMKYMQSAPLLRTYVPKNVPFAPGVRAAAIWALGHLYAGQPQPDLARLFIGRLADVDPEDPEDEEVRWMSAVSLGRMKATDTLPTLRRFLEEESVNGYVGYASAWAIHQIAGDPIPEPTAYETFQLGWFLEPIE